MRPARLAAWVAAAVFAVACGPDVVLDLDAAASGSPPPTDAQLAEAGGPEAAAWVDASIARTGQPVVVKFFASWCGPCEDEMPVLLDAMEDHPEVTVLGVDHQDRRDAAEAWIREHGADRFPTLYDVEGQAARLFGARGMPSVSFVDVEGRVLHTHTGPIDRGLLEAWIEHLTGNGPRPEPRPDDPAGDTPA